MPSQGRLGDKSYVAADTHGCPGCPHPAIGPAVIGSSNVFVNSRPALRVDDMGIHAPCCGPNLWKAVEGSATVFINDKAAHRMGDKDRHCGGDGKLVEGSCNVFVGDSGGGPAKCACDQVQLMKDAAKSGTPFFEGAMTALEKAKQAAVEKAKQAAQGIKNLIDEGLKGAQEQREGEKKGQIQNHAFIESKEGYTDPEASIKVGYQVEDKFYDDQVLYYGNENANIKVGHAEATAGFGYSYDLEKDEHEFTLGQLKGKASVIEGEAKGKALKGLVEGGVKGEALSVAGELTLPSVTVSKEKVEAKAKVGAEVNLVKGEAECKINITPKTIYDNTVGSIVGWLSPKSKFASAPEWLDHGVVIGAKGEAGIGAGAVAEAKAGATKEMIYAEASVKLGAGPMAGLKLLLGIK